MNYEKLYQSILSESPEQPRSPAERAFKAAMIGDEEYINPASADFWQEMRDRAVLDAQKAFKRPADVQPETQRPNPVPDMSTQEPLDPIWDDLYQDEQVVGTIEGDEGARVSIIPIGGTLAQRYNRKRVRCLCYVNNGKMRVLANGVNFPRSVGEVDFITGCLRKITDQPFITIPSLNAALQNAVNMRDINAYTYDVIRKKVKMDEALQAVKEDCVKFEQGTVTLGDGSTRDLDKNQVDALNTWFDQMTPATCKDTRDAIMTDGDSFDSFVKYLDDKDE